MTVKFAGWETLNENEQKLFEILQSVDNKSPWGMAVKNLCDNPDPARFRRLVCELKSQADDNAGLMKDILGPAYEPLMKL